MRTPAGLVTLVLFVLAGWPVGLSAVAQETPAAEESVATAEPAAAAEPVAKEKYVYTAGNRRDPFLSIIEAARQKKKKERERKKVRGIAPLEDYDLSQFNLIAIVQEGSKYLASIGLPDGKYYTLRTGTTVGIHGGKVLRITDGAVIIREYLPDYRGEIRAEDTAIRLREEEGE